MICKRKSTKSNNSNIVMYHKHQSFVYTQFIKQFYFKQFNLAQLNYCLVGWRCKILRLLLCREVRPLPNEYPSYDTKQSDCEVPVMLGLWGIRSIPSLPLLPGPLRPGMVAPDKGPVYGLNRTNCILMLNWIVWIRTVWLNWIAWSRNVFDD